MDMTTRELLGKKLMDAVEEGNDFAKAFLAAEDAQTLQKVLSENGFALTRAEVEEMFEEGRKHILNAGNEAELSEDQLDDVAGGGKIKGTLRFVASCAAGFGYGAFCGICPAAYAGAPYVAGGLAIWTAAGYKK